MPRSASVAAYRLQLRPGFGFGEAAALVPYLASLGVTHVYTSPVLEAESGSEHGYDLVDHARVRAEFGGEAGRLAFVAALQRAGLRWMLDIVPNHMSVASDRNAWWWDVLRNGPASVHAAAFDIDWRGEPPQVVLPILADELAGVLARNELVVDRSSAEAVLVYRNRRLPLRDGEGSRLDDAAALLARQHYRLVHWRRGPLERNYRCFFDIADLAGLRIEVPAVFEATHRLFRRWLAAGELDGLRIDHIDGLADPRRYLEQLRVMAPDAWIVVEKILAPDEDLPSEWPVEGTTGYEFARVLNGVFVDPSGAGPLTRLYEEFTAEHRSWTEVEADAKREIIAGRLACDVARVGRVLHALAAAVVPWLEFGELDANTVVDEALGSLDVYRTYLQPGTTADREDLRRIRAAMRRVRKRPGLAPELVDLLEGALSGRIDHPDAHQLAIRFQQLSGPVTAKGVEDTALYRYHRLVALNQVGGDPQRFGLAPWEFHRVNAEAAQRRPETLLTASTHDSKRSHDIRARLTLLSECPTAWADAVRRWARHNDRHRTRAVPDRNTEYLIYQTLVGAWPLDEDRAVDYFRKAAREAGVETSWLEPDEGYEAALIDFVVATRRDTWFVEEIEAFVDRLAVPAQITSLAATLLRLCSPGIPDLYQGDELWNLSLVDPDNRRPVDFAHHQQLLTEACQLDAHDAWPDDKGLAKLWLIHRVLQFRARQRAAFAVTADYLPLYGRGDRPDHLVAFARGGQVIVVVPRLVLGLEGGWGSTTLSLPPGDWTDVLDDRRRWQGTVDVSAVLAGFPVALLATGDQTDG